MVKKAIILLGGMGTRFLPLSKTVPKELWPLVDKPIIHYFLEGLKASGINRVVFVLSSEKKQTLSYFKKNLKLERILKKKKNNRSLTEIENLKELQQGFSLFSVFQQKDLGDGQAILQAKVRIGKEPFAVLSCNDIVDAEIPCISQLLRVFKTCQKPVVGLVNLSSQETSCLAMAETEKIAHGLFKIKKIIDGPRELKDSSNLAIIGKSILTPEIFDYLKIKKSNEKQEITLIHALKNMLRHGKIVYGYEVQGKWLGLGDKLSWLKSNFYLALKHPEYGHELKRYLKANI